MTRRDARQRLCIERYLDRSLDDLEGLWEEPPRDATSLVAAAHRLHAKPLRELSDEELRLALSQQIGFPWVLDLALSHLGEDPLREGDMYPADMLTAALKLPPEKWTPEQRAELHRLAAGAVAATRQDENYDLLRRAWEQAAVPG